MTKSASNTSSNHLSYSQAYLKQYWPEAPDTPAGWKDNEYLMDAYQDAALAIRKHFGGKKVRMLDVSSGPALGPLLGMMTAISDVQLSDYEEDNRRSLQSAPVEYWRNYVPMLTKVYDNPEGKSTEILRELDTLRKMHPPVAVDLFKDPPFPPSIDPRSFEVISVQFVADSITKTLEEYFTCLRNCTNMVRENGILVMSALTDSNGWEVGEIEYPSPHVSEEAILAFIENEGLSILHLSRLPLLEGLTYSGGWIVFSAVRTRAKYNA